MNYTMQIIHLPFHICSLYYLYFRKNLGLFQGKISQSLIYFRLQAKIRCRPCVNYFDVRKAGTDPVPVNLTSSLVSQRPLLLLGRCIPLLTQPGEDPTPQGGLLPGQDQVPSLRVQNLNTDSEPNSRQALGTNLPRLNSLELSFHPHPLPGGLGLLPPAAFVHGPPLTLAQPPNLGVGSDPSLSLTWHCGRSSVHIC